MINELFGIVFLTNSCTFFLFFFFLSTFRILFTGIRNGSLSLFLLQFKLSFKATPFLKLLEHSKLFSQYAVQILTSIALQFLYAVTKAWQGFRVALRTLKIVAFLCKLTAGLTLLLTTTATEFVCFETAMGQLANGRQVTLLGSLRLRPQRVSWLNGRQGTLLGLFVLRPQWVSWLNGRQVTLLGLFRLRPQRVSWLNGRQGTLLGLFVLRPQWVSWLNGRQATLLGLFCMRPQRVSWLKYGEQ